MLPHPAGRHATNYRNLYRTVRPAPGAVEWLGTAPGGRPGWAGVPGGPGGRGPRGPVKDLPGVPGVTGPRRRTRGPAGVGPPAGPDAENCSNPRECYDLVIFSYFWGGVRFHWRKEPEFCAESA